jgi:hypothetical protein
MTGEDGYPSQAIAPLKVEAVNMVFPANGEEAAAVILAAAATASCDVIAGVFPAHVAVELYRAGARLAMPVALPAPAKEGEVRGGGFVHDHWEFVHAQ